MKKYIKGYGFEYSFSHFMKTSIFVLAGMVLTGFLYQLKWPGILIIVIAAIISVPLVMMSQIRYLNEQRRFSDAATYMEQMIYMFKKRPQVLFALRETKDILSEKAKKICEEAIYKLESGDYQTNMYEESLQCIEEQYGCDRMRVIHRFLFRVEAEGGVYQDSMNLLLDDLKGWIQRVYEFQKERKKIKNNIIISIFATLIICFLTTKIFPSEYSISGKVLYQITSTLMILLMMGVYVLTQAKLCGTWLADKAVHPKRILRDYHRATFPGVGVRPPILLLVLAIIAIVYGIIVKQWLLVCASLIGGVFLWGQPQRSKRAAVKRCERELKKAFPIWLMELALILQRKPVSAAIIESIPTAPFILQLPLRKMEKQFEEDLISIKPYQDFVSEFEVPEISSAMKLLYAMNATGREDMLGQIHALLERNTRLQEKSETLQEKDHIAICGFLVAFPMIFSFVKLVTDMLLLVSGFLERFSGFI